MSTSEILKEIRELSKDEKLYVIEKAIEGFTSVNDLHRLKQIFDELIQEEKSEVTEKVKTTITERIRKLTKPVNISDDELKKIREGHLESKYGK